MASFSQRLAEAIRRKGTPAMVGIDPHLHLLPEAFGAAEGDFAAQAAGVEAFGREVIDVVGPLVPALKFQMAFFEMLGPSGMAVLKALVAHARRHELVVILDGKRNDIGSTAVAYAEGLLGTPENSPWAGDALTVNPYLGDDSLRPFVEVCQQRDCGIFVLVKTSNPGGGLFQDLTAEGVPIYRHVACEVERLAAETCPATGAADDAAQRFGCVGAVVGATYPEQLAELRQAMPHAWLLVPGFGSQGATAADVAGAFCEDGLGAVVNNSRGILFAYRREEYAELGPQRWREATEAATRAMIEQLRRDTPAAVLTIDRR